MEIEEIVRTYSNMATIQLVGLVNEIGQLREDVIPYLRAELIKREELESVDVIDEYIKVDDEVRSVNFVNASQREIIKFITKSRSKNINEVEIDVSLAEDFGLNSDEIRNIKEKCKKRGTIQMILVVVFIVLFFVRLYLIYSLIDSGSNYRRGYSLSFWLGFIRLVLYVIIAVNLSISSSLLLKNSNKI